MPRVGARPVPVPGLGLVKQGIKGKIICKTVKLSSNIVHEIFAIDSKYSISSFNSDCFTQAHRNFRCFRLLLTISYSNHIPCSEILDTLTVH